MAYKAATRSPFFLYLTLAFLAIAIAGFSTTLFAPVARGEFKAPLVIRIHGALLFGWLTFLIAQASLIHSKNVRIHRRIGWFGAILCVAIIVSVVLVDLFTTRRDLAAGAEGPIIGNFVNILIEMILFGSLVGTAIFLRRDTESHKRLLVLATISILGPAWLRFRHFMPFVPNPFVAFSFVADSVLLVVIARDWIAFRRVHRVYLWVGGIMVAIHAVELSAIESQPWLRLGRWLLGEAAV
ncbi:MAG: hypothetical protein ACREPP_02985 [Rhodanobacteraceae bacterium]